MRDPTIPGAVLLLGPVLLLGAPPSAAAQVELVLDAGIGAFAGGDFDGRQPGPSLGAALHFADWPEAHGGLEVGYSRHDGRVLESATTQLEFLGLARRHLLSGPLDVHLGAKLGVGRRSLRIVDEPAAADGFAIGPSAAVRFEVGARAVQLTLDALYQTFEELTMYGSREYGTDEDGLRLTLRGGLVLPLEAAGTRSDPP